jgi:hypothetical protein
VAPQSTCPPSPRVKKNIFFKRKKVIFFWGRNKKVSFEEHVFSSFFSFLLVVLQVLHSGLKKKIVTIFCPSYFHFLQKK